MLYCCQLLTSASGLYKNTFFLFSVSKLLCFRICLQNFLFLTSRPAIVYIIGRLKLLAVANSRKITQETYIVKLICFACFFWNVIQWFLFTRQTTFSVSYSYYFLKPIPRNKYKVNFKKKKKILFVGISKMSFLQIQMSLTHRSISSFAFTEPKFLWEGHLGW